jgi:hypothetical protein
MVITEEQIQKKCDHYVNDKLRFERKKTMNDLKKNKEQAQNKFPIIDCIDNRKKYVMEEKEFIEKLSMETIEKKCLEFQMAKMEEKTQIQQEKKEVENKLIEQTKMLVNFSMKLEIDHDSKKKKKKKHIKDSVYGHQKKQQRIKKKQKETTYAKTKITNPTSSRYVF